MPGIEARAPERTETSSGLARSPKVLPVMRADLRRARCDLRFELVRIGLAVGVVVVQTSVVMVKPGGTGRPRLAISARPAPLPPSRLRMLGRALGLAVAEACRPICAACLAAAPACSAAPLAGLDALRTVVALGRAAAFVRLAPDSWHAAGLRSRLATERRRNLLECYIADTANLQFTDRDAGASAHVFNVRCRADQMPTTIR